MDETGPPALLEVEDLRVETLAEARPLLHGVSLRVGRESVALVGESGSGKSLTARAVLGLAPRGLGVRARRLMLAGQDLTQAPPRAFRRLLGGTVGFVLQDPRTSLNPVQRVGRQVEEALVLHTRLTRAERRERSLDMLARVGLDDPVRVYQSYPSELSGGMGQRAMIAAMLVAGPCLLVADEPTSALDARVRGQILALLRSLAEERGMGLLLISHDLPAVAEATARALVMRAGRIVDELPSAGLPHATHPYTRALWRARPSAATHGTHLPVAAQDSAAQDSAALDGTP